MTTPLLYEYQSVYAPYIEGLILQKKADGFIYDYESYILKKFDDFCIMNEYTDSAITRDIAMEWAIQSETEGVNYRNQRVSFLRQLSLYMNSMGINSYIPQHIPSSTISAPHILNAEELQSVFSIIDDFIPGKSEWHYFRMEYQLLFRLYYCCGMRLAEGCNLKKQDVDLSNGIITVRKSKGRKDRLVYMAEDLTELCRTYIKKIALFHPGSTWLFPGRAPGKHIHKTGVDNKFQQFWEKTSYSGNCDKRPTVHALRHTFVVNRMNMWMEEGVSLDVMMPYLSRYLGHNGIDDTLYYYHHVSNAFKIVRERDCISSKVIPEVVPYEE